MNDSNDIVEAFGMNGWQIIGKFAFYFTFIACFAALEQRLEKIEQAIDRKSK